MYKKKKKKKGKQRIISKKVKIDNINFKSKLEGYFYSKAKEKNIKVEYEKRSFEIFPDFYFDGKKIRSINYTPDFESEKDRFFVEIKGYMVNESFPLRFKLFKKYLLDNNMEDYKVYLLKNQREINEFFNNYKK